MTGIPSIYRLVSWYRKNNFKSIEEIERLQRERLKSLISYAIERSPFFKSLYRGIDIDRAELCDLPVVTKEMVKENFDEYLTERDLKQEELKEFVLDSRNMGKKFKGKYIAFHTSGTSGPPLILVYSEKAFDHVKAIIFARGTPVNPNLYRLLKCIFHKRPRHAIILMDGGLYPAITNVLYLPPLHWLVFDVKIISIFMNIDEIVQELNEFDPWFITGYPHILARLAREKRCDNLRIFDDVPAKRIMSVSEPLTPPVRRFIEETFETPVINHYGTGECLTIARDCYEERRMHINSDMCILEVVDKDYRPVPAGERGDKVLVTNLFNYIQPFIRYEVNDVVTLSKEKCSCGLPFPTIESIEGKSDEVFVFKRDDGREEPIHPTFFVEPLGRFFEIQEYRVGLVEDRRIEVTVEAAKGVSVLPLDKIRGAIISSLERGGLSGIVDLVVKEGKVEADPKTGKVRRFVDYRLKS